MTARARRPVDLVPEEVRVAVGELVEANAYLVTVTSLPTNEERWRPDIALERVQNEAWRKVGRCQYRVAAALAAGGYAGTLLEELSGRSDAGSERARQDVAAARHEREAAGR